MTSGLPIGLLRYAIARGLLASAGALERQMPWHCQIDGVNLAAAWARWTVTRQYTNCWTWCLLGQQRA